VLLSPTVISLILSVSLFLFFVSPNASHPPYTIHPYTHTHTPIKDVIEEPSRCDRIGSDCPRPLVVPLCQTNRIFCVNAVSAWYDFCFDKVEKYSLKSTLPSSVIARLYDRTVYRPRNAREEREHTRSENGVLFVAKAAETPKEGIFLLIVL